MSVQGATVWEVLWTIFAGSIIVGCLVLIYAQEMRRKSTWAGRLGVLLCIPGGIAMGEGSVPALAVVLTAIAVLALIDRHLRNSRRADPSSQDAASA